MKKFKSLLVLGDSSRKVAVGLLAVMILSACSTMPRSGPSTRAVESIDANAVLTDQEADYQNKALIVDLNDEVSNQLSHQFNRKMFSELWGGVNNADVIGEGDVLEITIWEAPPAVLFGGVINAMGTGSSQVTRLPEQMVDSGGRVKIPFVGSLKVSGQSVRQIENTIASRLSRMANQPQVIVRQVKNNAANVTVIREGSSVRMPLTSKGERVLDAVSAIGGVQAANKTSIQLTRGAQVRSLPLITITQDPQQNVMLKPGDVVTAIYQPLSFIVLGATGRNEEVNFEGQGISLVQALGRVRGLDDNRADASSVFVFRYEDAQTANAWNRNGVAQYNRKLPVVYRANLRDANTFFHAQNFMMQDKDILYVANAPASELQKFLRIIFSLTSPVTSTINSVDRIN